MTDIPPDWFIESLLKLQERCYMHTIVKRPFALLVTAEFGLRIGLAPGESMQVAGPSGYITITSEHKP